MVSRSLRVGVLLVVVLLSSSVLAQEKPVEPTTEQLQKAKDEFAKIGATYDAVIDPLTKRVTHTFRLAAKTQDADLKNLPNPPFSLTLNLQSTQVTDVGLKELMEVLPKCQIGW